MLIRFFHFLIGLLKKHLFFIQLLQTPIRFFQFDWEIFLYVFIISSFESKLEMIRCFELICLDDFQESFTSRRYFKHTYKCILLKLRSDLLLLTRVLAQIKQVNKLIRKLLEVNHDLLLILKDMVILFRAVHQVKKVWILLIC